MLDRLKTLETEQRIRIGRILHLLAEETELPPQKSLSLWHRVNDTETHLTVERDVFPKNPDHMPDSLEETSDDATSPESGTIRTRTRTRRKASREESFINDALSSAAPDSGSKRVRAARTIPLHDVSANRVVLEDVELGISASDESDIVLDIDDTCNPLPLLGLDKRLPEIVKPLTTESEQDAETHDSLPNSLDGADPSPIDAKEPVIDSVDGASNAPSQDLEQISLAMASLYLNYRQSVAKLASLTPLDAISEAVAAASAAEYVMTKSQLDLMRNEGNLWNELAGFGILAISDGDGIDRLGATEDHLNTLTRKSQLMKQSYDRRTHPPTKQTYDECKDILKAMGLPCLEVDGPYEAEALASSLVLNGYADYVASEDTVCDPCCFRVQLTSNPRQDVLVYEAPMIRNITSKQSPLVIVSGLEVRSVLELDRSSYVDFALLLGTDFSQRIKNVGPARALKFIKEHHTIERIIELETKYPPRIPVDAYLEQVELARSVFKTLPPVPEDHTLLETKESDEDVVLSILHRHRLHKLIDYDWDPSIALDGNYFEDNPAA